jgi:thioesterase domain-containing protein
MFMDDKISDLLKKLSPERRALLAFRLNLKHEAAPPSSEAGAILARARGAELAPHSPLVAIQPGGDRRPFFCVHPAGGHIFCYVELARHLGAQQPFYGFQSRDADGAAGVRRSVEALAASYVQALVERQPAGPYALGGWSMGGVVAYEMARQLQSSGHEVALLTLLDSRIPTAAERFEVADEVSLIVNFASDLGVPLGRLGLSRRNVRQLDVDERLAFILREAKAARVIPQDIELAFIRTFFATFRENALAMCAYAPQPYPGRVTLFKAEAVSPGAGDAAMGWGEWAGGGVEVLSTPGSHSTMTREPHVRTLAAQLRARLRDAE